ncbi:MAG: hypothetical protein PUG74_00340, partial [Prevotellaceae bacterium]|nr:hypothetical protein [Prevotellaceae bacterium]
MGYSNNSCCISGAIISGMFYALSSFTRRKYFAAYFIDVISHLMHHNPDSSLATGLGDESGTI